MADLTQNFNYLQPTSFQLTVDRENYPNLQFFCQSFVHPGMIMNSVEVPYKKVTGVPFIGDKLTFNEKTKRNIELYLVIIFVDYGKYISSRVYGLWQEHNCRKTFKRN